MDFIKVVCGIVWKEGKILLARKRPDKPLGGFWEFPGGKIEANEEPINALKRELLEELGLEIINIHYLDTHLYTDSSISIELIGYHADFKEATFDLKNHDKIEFVAPVKLMEYDIAPADQLFLQKFMP